MEFVHSFDKLDVVVKVILTVFFDPIVGGVYRIAKGRILVGLLWLFTGFFGIGWIIDIITVAQHNKYTVLV
jgi:hypothetical protein